MTRATLCFCFYVCFCFPSGALCGPFRHVKLSDQRPGLITAAANAPTAAFGLISPASSLVTSPTANPPYSLLLQVSFLALLICYGRRQRQHQVGHFLPAFRLPRTRLYVRRPSQQSSGRGGVGNIRRTSIDPNSPKTPNFNPEDDVTMNRGREPAQAGDKDRVSVFALQCSFFPFDFVPPSRPSSFELIARDRVFADITFFVTLFRVQIPDRLPTRGLACEPSRSSLVLTTTHRHGRGAPDVCTAS
ncbi:hypothetical protein POSPLADRAFT_1139548 [Postia placenta MAD-698-R-SB12]|uniref:Secreted protein n=1 Tax=Postia placenta MAD-698-R-SB12 TaxID=670580 RepID=A0A1X6N3X2_9APHY|nr:hypothetical protein POSPLADRAFT_1139548 [Postia placenta MAD-698-R-SB12]OSX63176.1 hypothetical protein POSPLADRAFT_1139548 [Postia placenta MAD-698-R-SB12]